MSAQTSPITSVEEVSSPLQHKEETISNLGMKLPMSVHYVLGRPMQNSKDEESDSEDAETTDSTDSLFDLTEMNRADRHSPLPSNDVLAEARNERRYRLLLEHQFHPSRKFTPQMILLTIKFGNIPALSYFAALEPSLRTAWRCWLPF